jgi:hypothetical protein
MGRVGDSIDNATAPLRRGLEKVDDNLRNAVGNLGDRTRNLVDELGRPFQPRSNAADNRAPLGADANNPNAPAWNGNAPTWNGSAATAAPADSPAPRYSEASNSWNGADAARLPEAPPFALPEQGATGSAADTATGSRSSSPGNVDWNGPAGSTSAQRIDQPIDPRDVGRWENASPESTQNRGGALGASDSDMQASAGRSSSGDVRTDAQAPRMGTGAAGNPAGFPAGPTSVGPRLPGFENDLASDKPEGARESARNGGAAGSPKIELDMLQQPATRPLEGTESAEAPASNVVGPAFPSPNAPGAASTAQTPNVPTAGARAQGWDWARREGTSQPAGAQPANDGGGRQTAAALFAWVLLTSSAAGNLYLFWSYQDVRHKYRALVRKTARAVGSRLSAA